MRAVRKPRKRQRREELYLIPLAVGMLCASLFCFVRTMAERMWGLDLALISLSMLAVCIFHYFCGIDKRKQYVVASIFLLGICLTLPSHDLWAALLSTLCFIGALMPLFHSFHSHNCENKLFLSGFFVGVGGLFCGVFLWTIPLFLMGIYILRCLSLHVLVAFSLGIVLPFWLALGGCLFLEDWTLLADSLSSVISFAPLLMRSVSLQEVLVGLSSVPLLFFMSVNFAVRYPKELFRHRAYLTFLLIAMLYVASLACLFTPYAIHFCLVGMVPFSCLLAFALCALGGKR